MASVEIGNGGDGDMAGNRRLPDVQPENWIEYFQFKYSRDTASEARDALLVVAALFAQVTFQAGTNPPDYITQNAQYTGIGALNLTIFLVANSLGFSAALVIIKYLTANMPFQRELRMAMFGMGFVYSFSLGSIKPFSIFKTAIILVSCFIPILARSFPNLANKIICRRTTT